MIIIDFHWLSLIKLLTYLYYYIHPILKMPAWPEHLLEKWPCKSPRLQLTASSRPFRMINHLKDQFHEKHPLLCIVECTHIYILYRWWWCGLNREGVSGKLWVVIANWKSIHNQYSIIFQFLHDKLFWQKRTFLSEEIWKWQHNYLFLLWWQRSER